MNRRIGIGICALVPLLAWGFHRAQQSYRSTTFAGPEFHSLDGDDVGNVHAELSRYLESEGFVPSTSPSELDSWAGVHSKGGRRSWFVKRGSEAQATHICVDLDEITVRTQVKWEARGTTRKLQSAERLAYSSALDLDTWINSIKERNVLPLELRETKRQDFENHVAGDG